MGKKCRFCDEEVPGGCNGQIEDHCTWCGTWMDPEPGLASDKDRFCTLDCSVENEEWEKSHG